MYGAKFALPAVVINCYRGSKIQSLAGSLALRVSL